MPLASGVVWCAVCFGFGPCPGQFQRGWAWIGSWGAPANFIKNLCVNIPLASTKKNVSKSCYKKFDQKSKTNFFLDSPRARFDFPNPFPHTHTHSPRLGAGRRAFACSSSCSNRLLSPSLVRAQQRILTAFFLDHYEHGARSASPERPPDNRRRT
jgi:hypothetical protein